MIGNILIAIIVISYGSLVNLSAKPMPSGDYGVGYAFMWLVSAAGFVVSTGLLAWNMNLNHCFDWAPASFLRYRNVLLVFGWIAFVAASIWSLTYNSDRAEGGFPQFMSWLTSSKVYIWLPLLMLLPALYFVNAQRLAGFAPVWVKIPMQAGYIISSLLALGILWAFGKFWVERQIGQNRMANTWQAERQSTYNSDMEYINNYSEETIQGLLKFAHPENDARQRTAAIAKIKSFENWENDLVKILEQKKPDDLYVYDDPTYDVFAFLDGNEIEHPEKFIQPVIYSITILTKRVRKSINDPYNLDLHKSDVEAVCRVLDAQFKISAKEFRPGMVKLQEALDITPPERKNEQHKKAYMKTLHTYRLAVKNWLKSNS